MASFWESIKVDGEDMKLYVCVPDGKGPFPAVVVIQHQGGVDQFVEDMTQRIASAGYVGVAPVLYHRDGPDCTDDGPTRRARLQDVTVIKDVNATVDFLKGHPGVDSARLGIVGFCMGGRVAYLMASGQSQFQGRSRLLWGQHYGLMGRGPISLRALGGDALSVDRVIWRGGHQPITRRHAQTRCRTDQARQGARVSLLSWGQPCVYESAWQPLPRRG